MTNVVHLPIVQPDTREQRRSRRKRAVRPLTVSVKRMTKRELNFGKMIADANLAEIGPIERPRTRGECEGGERPCPFVSCKRHLYLDVSKRTGAIKLNFPDIEPDELEKMPATCVLDFGDRPQTLEQVGALMNTTRERVRQVELVALTKMRREASNTPALSDYADDYPDTGRVTASDVSRLDDHERTKAMPNYGYSDKVWNVLTVGRRTSVEQIAKDAEVSYATAKNVITNFHQSGKVQLFEDGGVELVPGAVRHKRRDANVATPPPAKASTEQKKTADIVHMPKVKDLSHAPTGASMSARFTLRYFNAQIDCASANDVAELIGAIKRVIAS